jgi:hypothetical protein
VQDFTRISRVVNVIRKVSRGVWPQSLTIGELGALQGCLALRIYKHVSPLIDATIDSRAQKQKKGEPLEGELTLGEGK